MAVEKTKHEFVDDNPYLVYSGEPDTSVDNAGGGGGGDDDSPFLYVTVTEDLSTWTDEGIALTISENKDAIVNAMRAGMMVLFIVNEIVGSVTFQHYIRANIIAQDNSGVSATYINTFSGVNYCKIIVGNDSVRGIKYSE